MQATLALPIPLGRSAAFVAAAVLVAPLGTRARWWAPISTWLGPRLVLGAEVVPGGALGWVLATQAVVLVASTLGASLRTRA